MVAKKVIWKQNVRSDAAKKRTEEERFQNILRRDDKKVRFVRSQGIGQEQIMMLLERSVSGMIMEIWTNYSTQLI